MTSATTLVSKGRHCHWDYNEINAASGSSQPKVKQFYWMPITYEPLTKPTEWHVCPANTPISLGICPVWSGCSLSTWRKLGSLATHWAHSEDSYQTWQMPRLNWVFAGCTVVLLVLWWGGWYVFMENERKLSPINHQIPVLSISLGCLSHFFLFLRTIVMCLRQLVC